MSEEFNVGEKTVVLEQKLITLGQEMATTEMYVPPIGRQKVISCGARMEPGNWVVSMNRWFLLWLSSGSEGAGQLELCELMGPNPDLKPETKLRVNSLWSVAGDSEQ